jgi:tetratricopeptide (TPR) repeat protein
LQPKPQAALGASGLESWASQAIRRREFPAALMSIGALRLTRELAAAASMLEELRPHVPARWQPAFVNEEAALAWHNGDAAKARDLWAKAAPSAPVFFNRGMSALFTDRPVDARTAMSEAIALLPDDNAWHHLGRLYLALAQIQ